MKIRLINNVDLHDSYLPVDDRLKLNTFEKITFVHNSIDSSDITKFKHILNGP